MSKGSTVVIGCKFPTGIKLEIGAPGESNYQSVDLKGANEGEIREGGLFVAHTVGGFGRTTVAAAFWDAWKNGAGIVGTLIREPGGVRDVTADQNKADQIAARKALVDEWQAKGLVFVVDTVDAALAQANDKATVKTGFESLAQAGDPRASKQITKAA